MSRTITAVVLVIFVAVGLLSCFDPEPSEISIIATLNGERQGCAVQVFNAQGKQIQEESTDWHGIGYVKQLAPGTYTLKFIDNHRNQYPAEVTVTLKPGESKPVQVELSQGPAASDTEE
jgi:hypothetical protein